MALVGSGASRAAGADGGSQGQPQADGHQHRVTYPNGRMPTSVSTIPAKTIKIHA
jgi:hypothetical protein